MNLTEFFQKGEVIDNEKVFDTYTSMGLRNNLQNYRIFTLNSLIKGLKVSRGKDIPEFIYDFIAEQGISLGIANIINDIVYSMVFRSVKEKKFLTCGSKRSMPYGIGDLDPNFKYGDFLVLVEGMKDRDSIKSVYPNVVSTNTAGTTVIMREVLLTLTNNFIILYDSDEPGVKASYYDRKYFLNKGCNAVIVKQPSGVKDSGTISDLQYQGDTFKSEYLKNYYKTNINTIIRKRGY